MTYDEINIGDTVLCNDREVLVVGKYNQRIYFLQNKDNINSVTSCGVIGAFSKPKPLTFGDLKYKEKFRVLFDNEVLTKIGNYDINIYHGRSAQYVNLAIKENMDVIVLGDNVRVVRST